MDRAQQKLKKTSRDAQLNVVIRSPRDDGQWPYRGAIAVEINGTTVFYVHDGKPEDATLSKNFNDCYKIRRIIELAFAAGKNGRELSIEYADLDD